MKVRKIVLLIAVLVITAAASSCASKSQGMMDGYYTAEAASFDANGWKEYVTIYVNNDTILTVEYNAFNASGFVKSWDLDYMRTMNITSGTYPNEFTRSYAVGLINWQDPDRVDAVSGATHSHITFIKLAKAAIEKAVAGDKSVALVELSESIEITEG